MIQYWHQRVWLTCESIEYEFSKYLPSISCFWEPLPTVQALKEDFCSIEYYLTVTKYLFSWFLCIDLESSPPICADYWSDEEVYPSRLLMQVWLKGRGLSPLWLTLLLTSKSVLDSKYSNVKTVSEYHRHARNSGVLVAHFVTFLPHIGMWTRLTDMSFRLRTHFQFQIRWRFYEAESRYRKRINAHGVLGPAVPRRVHHLKEENHLSIGDPKRQMGPCSSLKARRLDLIPFLRDSI